MKVDPSVDYFSKYSSEVFGIEYDFTNDLGTGETVSSATVTITDSTGADRSAAMISSETVSTPDVTFTLGSTKPYTL